MNRIVRAGLSVAVLLLAAEAQTPSVDYADLVEAGRPRVAVRSLSQEEQKQAAKALSQWRSRKTEANLAAVRPFAQAGDRASLQAMVEGYLHLQKEKRDRGASAALAKPETALKPLAALWATAWWREAGGSLTAAKALAPCLTNNMQNTEDVGRFDYHRSNMLIPSQTTEFDCGFDTKGTIPALEAIRIAARDNKAPKAFLPVTFIEHPVVGRAAIEEDRLKKVLAEFVAVNGLYDISEVDRKWLYERASREPDVARRLEEARFDQRLTLIARHGGVIPQNDSMWAYMQADPERIRRYERAVATLGNRMLADNVQVTNTLTKGRPEDRESSSWLAIKSKETANLWWRTYGGNISGNVPMLPYWCGAGVEEACSRQQQANTTAEFRDKYGDPASLNSGRFAGASGSIDQSQFAKEKADAKAACLAANINGGEACAD